MTCREVRNLSPLYFSGEMPAEERKRFSTHLAACPACEQEIEQYAQVDERLAASIGSDLPDSVRIEQAVRRQIAAARAQRRFFAAGAIAAGVALAIIGTYAFLRFATPPRLYTDAAEDHHAEVIEKQPRRWRSSAPEIETLVQQSGLSGAQVASLAPQGYSLELAKNCGIDGQRMLHLVFTNGVHRYSVFVRAQRTSPQKVRIYRSNSEEVASLDTGQFRAIVVTVGPKTECRELAEIAAAHL